MLMKAAFFYGDAAHPDRLGRKKAPLRFHKATPVFILECTLSDQVKSVRIHHLVPRHNEVGYEFFARILLAINFRQRP